MKCFSFFYNPCLGIPGRFAATLVTQLNNSFIFNRSNITYKYLLCGVMAAMHQIVLISSHKICEWKFNMSIIIWQMSFANPRNKIFIRLYYSNTKKKNSIHPSRLTIGIFHSLIIQLFFPTNTKIFSMFIVSNYNYRWSIYYWITIFFPCNIKCLDMRYWIILDVLLCFLIEFYLVMSFFLLHNPRSGRLLMLIIDWFISCSYHFLIINARTFFFQAGTHISQSPSNHQPNTMTEG